MEKSEPFAQHIDRVLYMGRHDSSRFLGVLRLQGTDDFAVVDQAVPDGVLRQDVQKGTGHKLQRGLKGNVDKLLQVLVFGLRGIHPVDIELAYGIVVLMKTLVQVVIGAFDFV